MDNAIVKSFRRPCNHFFNHSSLDAANGFPAALKKRSRRNAQTVENGRQMVTFFDKLKRLRYPQALAYNN